MEKSAGPEEMPVQPIRQPVQRVRKPVRRPVQPVRRPVQPIRRPVQPVGQPVQPVRQPVRQPFQRVRQPVNLTSKSQPNNSIVVDSKNGKTHASFNVYYSSTDGKPAVIEHSGDNHNFRRGFLFC